MERKGYLKPEIQVAVLNNEVVLAGSTGATIPGFSWGARQRSHESDKDDWEYEE